MADPTRRIGRRSVLFKAASGLGFLVPIDRARADGPRPIRIGVLHSLSGTMAISETTLRDTVLMMVAWINAQGGLLGRPVEAVVVDPASDWPLFALKARELLEAQKVDVTFGCWTSASRKAVLPVFEALNGLLFYPVQYEGQEESRNVFYTGAAPNQQATPAVDYLMRPEGGSTRRFALLGTDYVYPRTTNDILRGYLGSLGVAADDIMEEYTPFGFSEWKDTVGRVKRFAGAGKRTALLSTINGDANVPFYRELGRQGVTASDLPCLAFSVGEEELAGMNPAPLVGHLAAWNYFMSVQSAENAEFVAMWHDYIKDPRRVTNDPMEATCTGFRMWTQAVTAAGTTEVDAVRRAMIGQTVRTPSGYTEEMHANHHLSKPVMIGRIRADGQFDIVSKTSEVVPAENSSPYVDPELGHQK